MRVLEWYIPWYPNVSSKLKKLKRHTHCIIIYFYKPFNPGEENENAIHVTPPAAQS